MNTNKKTTIRNFLCSIISIFMFVLASICALNISKRTTDVYATDGSSKVTITNSNFISDNNNVFPIKSVTGFNAYSNNKQVTTLNENCGVIDLSDEDYATRFSYALENRVGMDNKVLMLTSDSTNFNYGYRTKNTITMNANSNYMISVDVLTEENAGIANISLYNGDEVFAEINNINTSGVWTRHYIFVTTGEESLSLNFGMNITNAGTVLFDDIACYEISNSVLTSNINTQKEIGVDYVHANEVNSSSLVESYIVEDNQLFNGTKYIKLNNTNSASGQNNSDYTEISTVYDNDGKTRYDNVGNEIVNKAIKINNKQKTFVEYTTEDNFLTFEQSLIYKVSVSVKAKNLNGSATLKLVQTNLEDEETATDSSAITISSNTSSEINNDYQTYSFYIKGHPRKSTNYNLVVALGSKDGLTSGELYISEISVNKIKTSNISSSANTIDLVGDLAVSSNDLYFNNGKFDALEITDIENPFPATATGWTATKGTGTQTYGIVNTLNENFEKLTNKLNNPYATETNQNVLMMYNDNADTLVYKSSSKTLNKNSYHKVEIDVQSQYAPIKISLIAEKDGKEFEIASKSVQTGTNNWKTLTFYIKTGYSSLTVNLKATLISDNKACAFLDNARFDYPGLNETEYTSASNGDYSTNVDLTNLFATSETTNFAKTNLFNGESNDNAVYGIVNANSDNLASLVGEENVVNFKNPGFDKVLAIRTNEDMTYTVTSNLGYNLEAEKKYILSVDVFTNLRTEVEDADLEKLGIGIKLTGFEDAFVEKSSNGVWTTYTFYIQPDTAVSSAYLEFTIGSENQTAIGSAYFGNIKFITEDDEEFDANTFDNQTTSDYDLVLKTVEVEESEEETDTNSTTEEESTFDKQTLLYLIPSILFAVAIVITVVGVFVRKIKWKKPSHKSKNEYDRNKTVSKQYYERKATMVREQKLRELNKQLSDLHNDRINFEEEYKHNLSKLREMKIKRADKNEIAKLEKEMKKNQKTSSVIGMSVTKLEREIEYVKSDIYYNSLVKQLSMQKVEESDEQ